MSLIVSEVYEALLSVGASDQHAKAAAGAIPTARDLATKQDIIELRAEVAEQRTATKEDIFNLRVDMATKEDIVELRAEMATKQDIADVRAEMATKQDIADLKDKMATKEDMATKRDIAVLKFAVFTIILGMFGLLFKLVFFP